MNTQSVKYRPVGGQSSVQRVFAKSDVKRIDIPKNGTKGRVGFLMASRYSPKFLCGLTKPFKAVKVAIVF